MKKLTKVVLLSLLLGIACGAQAELERLPSSVILPEKKPTIRNVGPAVTQKSIKDYSLDKNQLFRCWQYGQLIVAENGFRGPGPAGQTLLSKNGKRLTGFDFGETFCLYMGD